MILNPIESFETGSSIFYHVVEHKNRLVKFDILPIQAVSVSCKGGGAGQTKKVETE